MTHIESGYWTAVLDDCPPGTRYLYCLNSDIDRPDPASLSQPDCVHEASELITRPAVHDDSWRGLPLDQYVIYELHVGTFTPEGTLDAIIPHLSRLKQLGVTAIELMPLAEFPGGRNWGYDGAYPFAVERNYGGIGALLRLIHACHSEGLAVILDVVYNHLGPEGNYLRDFGPYFLSCYKTPWGDGINFDGPNSDGVRRYFLENAMYWLRDCGIDALRLDAIHAIIDRSAYPFLQELADCVHDYAAESGRHIYLIAESDLNDSRILRPAREGGFGIDAQWADDFHHCLHVLLTGEKTGYYADYGTVDQLASVIRDGWLYTGQYSQVRRARYGNSPDGLEARQFVVCSQNHDQVGNRMKGDRLMALAGQAAAKLAAASVLLCPYVPLLFMGEEYGEIAPFLYFVSHGDPGLQEAVRRGRKEEFAAFVESEGDPPDPQSEATFLASKLNHDLRLQGPHAEIYRWYGDLLRLRACHPALRHLSKTTVSAETLEPSQTLIVRRHWHHDSVVLVLQFGDDASNLAIELPEGDWRVELNSLPESCSARFVSGCAEIDLPRFGCLLLANSSGC